MNTYAYVTVREFAEVICSAFDPAGEPTFARVSQGKVFCSQCGSTAHEVIS